MLCLAEWRGECGQRHELYITCAEYEQWRHDNDDGDAFFDLLRRNKNWKQCHNCKNAIENSDATFVLGGARFEGHATILCVRSEVFAQELASGFCKPTYRDIEIRDDADAESVSNRERSVWTRARHVCGVTLTSIPILATHAVNSQTSI